MNGLMPADILAAQLALLAALKPIVIGSVGALIGTVMFGVYRLCAGCISSDRQWQARP